MDDRIIEFIRGMRAAGVRVSLAESIDALKAVETLGIAEKGIFRQSLRATLVKESDDFAVFDELFPLYFGSGGPAMQNAVEDLSEDEQEMLKAALSALSGRLQQLMDWLTSGEGPTKEELEELARRAGFQWANNPQEGRWITRRMLRQMGFEHLEEMMAQLMQKLQEMGMSQDAIEKLMGVVEANRDALAEQVAQQIGLQIAQDRANRADELHTSDLMNKPFEALTAEESDRLRREVTRLVTQLRSRAALRRKRGRQGKFDAKGTIRANQRYGGVPFEMKLKKKKLKPSLVLLCDVSRSTESVVEFMLYITQALHDQVSKMRSFAYYDRLIEFPPEVLKLLGDSEAEEAFSRLRRTLPYRPYGTDLGHGLENFYDSHLSAVNGRTTLIILGDARNNYNSPRVDLIKDLQRRARRLIWLNPEHQRQWGSGDSDMLDYTPYCDAVYPVRSLAQLSAAVDRLLAGG
ncbi:MAG: VWA domain-containing protein [Candidatus Promineifilaceae bacterium]|nr:VWA domain-containing protein [Candidatus Promineifilaceae bacterium]